MDKKGLGIGQVFIFIVVAITFALIMIFGYSAITEFMKSGEEVQFIQFKTDLEDSVKGIYSDADSVSVEEFRPPSTFQQICFLDLDYGESNEMEPLKEENPIAFSVWEDAQEGCKGKSGNQIYGYGCTDENVFMTPPATVKIKVYRISIAEDEFGPRGYLCLPVRKGLFSLRLEGKGGHTELSHAPSAEELS